MHAIRPDAGTAVWRAAWSAPCRSSGSTVRVHANGADTNSKQTRSSQAWAGPFSPPFSRSRRLHYFRLWDTWLLYLHPFTAPLVLLGGTFRPIAPWEWAYGVLYSAAWAGLLLLAGRRAFDRFLVARERTR